MLEEVETQGFAKKELTRESALAVENVLFEAWEKEVRKRYHRSWVSKCFNRDSLQMKFDYRVFGEQPVDGRSLFISIHGGGNAPEALNTQQWQNQIRLCQPKEGYKLYVNEVTGSWCLVGLWRSKYNLGDEVCRSCS